MKKKVSKNSFIREVLRDDLDSGKKVALIPYRQIIENPDFSSEEENKTRFKLLNENGAFKGLLNNEEEVNCFVENIYKAEFSELKWCPKGNIAESDGIDVMTEGSRLFADILSYLKNNKITDEMVLDTLGNYFSGEIPRNDKKRLFIYKLTSNSYVLDGNHRAGAILLAISKGNLRGLFPIEIWSLEK